MLYLGEGRYGVVDNKGDTPVLADVSYATALSEAVRLNREAGRTVDDDNIPVDPLTVNI